MAGIEGPRRVMPQGRPSIGVDQGRRNILRAILFTGAAALTAPLGSMLHGCGEGGGVQGTRLCDIQEVIDQRLNRSLTNAMNVRFANGSLSFFVERELRIPEEATGFADEIRNGARLTVKVGSANGEIVEDARGMVCLANCSELDPVTRPYEEVNGIVVIGKAERNFEGFIMLRESQESPLRVVYRPMVDRKWAQPVQYGYVDGELKRVTMLQEIREDGSLAFRYYEVNENAEVVNSSRWLLEEDAYSNLHDRQSDPVRDAAGNLIASGSQLPIYYALYRSNGEGTGYTNTEGVVVESGETIVIPIPDTGLNNKDYQLILDLASSSLIEIAEELGGREALAARAISARAKVTLKDLYPVDRREDIITDEVLGNIESAAAVDITGMTHGPEFTVRAILEIKSAQDLLAAESRPVPELAYGGVIKFNVRLEPAEGAESCPPPVADAETDALADVPADTAADVPADSVTDGGTE